MELKTTTLALDNGMVLTREEGIVRRRVRTRRNGYETRPFVVATWFAHTPSGKFMGRYRVNGRGPRRGSFNGHPTRTFKAFKDAARRYL